MAIASNLSDFDVKYSDYSNKTIESVTIPLTNNQEIEITIEVDTTVTPNTTFIKVNNKDTLTTTEIPVIMTKADLKEYLQVLRDMSNLLPE